MGAWGMVNGGGATVACWAAGGIDPLVQSAQAGSAGAFDALVRRHEKQLYNTAYRLTGSYDDASDLVQIAFVRAWSNLRSFRGDGPFAAWMQGIVTNLYRDERKRRRARPPQRPLEAALGRNEGTIPGPERTVPDALTARAALDDLPPLLRRAVELRLDGLTLAEIAAVEGCTLPAVQARLRRAGERVERRRQRSAEGVAGVALKKQLYFVEVVLGPVGGVDPGHTGLQ